MSEMMKVPDGWEIDNLKALKIKLIDGDRGENYPKEDEFFDNGFCVFLSAKNVTKNGFKFNEIQFIDKEKDEKLRKGKLDRNDIVLTTRGTVGNIAYFDNTINYNHIRINSGMILLRNENKSLETGYLHTFLKSNIFDNQIVNTVFGSAQPQLTVKEIEKFFICFPKEKKEQEKIAKIISTLDKAIESTNRLIEKEKNIKTALMQELLTNGIDQNGQIRSPQTHTYKPSELGLIPDEWEVVSLEKIGNVITGNTPSTNNEDYYNGNISFIGPVDFVGQKYITKTEKTVSKDGLNYSREIPKDSILTVCIGSTIGKIALAVKQCCTNQQINALVCDKKYFSEFIFYAMSQFLQRQLDVEAGLQAVPIVNKSSFAKLVLPCPLDMEEQKQIAKILTTQDKKIQTEETTLAKLKELKKGLMNDLLSGKVRVKI